VISVDAESDHREFGVVASFQSSRSPEVIGRDRDVSAEVTVVFALAD
jgi:hypothetical protein